MTVNKTEKSKEHTDQWKHFKMNKNRAKTKSTILLVPLKLKKKKKQKFKKHKTYRTEKETKTIFLFLFSCALESFDRNVYRARLQLKYFSGMKNLSCGGRSERRDDSDVQYFFSLFFLCIKSERKRDKKRTRKISYWTRFLRHWEFGTISESIHHSVRSNQKKKHTHFSVKMKTSEKEKKITISCFFHNINESSRCGSLCENRR